jgi:hypothetical protein
MPKAKLLLFKEWYHTYDEYIYTLVDSTMEWEEITDDELEDLRINLHTLNPKPYHRFELVVLDEKPIQERLDTIRALLEKHKKDIEKRELAKKKEAADKEKKKLEKERKKYEELQKKFGKGE